MALGACQTIPNGDTISELDIEANFDGIQALIKEKKAQVVYISSTAAPLTRNETTVPIGEDLKDIGTICKVPKNCLRWSCALSYALQDAPYIEFDTPLPNPPLQYLEPVKYRCKDQEVSTTRWDAYCTDRGVIGAAESLYNDFCAPSAKLKPT